MTTLHASRSAAPCNGVDVARLNETIEAIAGDPSIAAFTFRASNRWVGGALNRTTIGDFAGAGLEGGHRTATFTAEADEHPVLLGADRAPNPVEWLLHALAGCLTTSMTYHAAARGIAIDAIESDFEGELDLRGFLGLDGAVPKGYRAIRATMRVRSAASTDELLRLAEFSPVYTMLSAALPVTLRVEKA